MQRCIGIIGRIFGHNFQAIYSSVEKPSGMKITDHTGSLRSDDIKRLSVLTENQYHGHVCTRCGYTVNKGVDSV